MGSRTEVGQLRTQLFERRIHWSALLSRGAPAGTVIIVNENERGYVRMFAGIRPRQGRAVHCRDLGPKKDIPARVLSIYPEES
jgi:hypothetical protein